MNELLKIFGTGQTFDALFYFTSCFDYRMTPENKMTLKLISNEYIFYDMHPKNFFLVFTHCDLIRSEDLSLENKYFLEKRN